MFWKTNFNVFVRFRIWINNLENSDVFRFNFQIESKIDIVEHMESDCHMTNPENNFFRTFEIEFSSKNRNFLFAMNFESPIKKSKNIAFFIVNNITFFCKMAIL